MSSNYSETYSGKRSSMPQGFTSVVKTYCIKIAPWLITAIAFYFVLRGIDFATFANHIISAQPIWIFAAVGLTALSYLFRSRRWQYLFTDKVLSFGMSARVLILGFFMNNILPARTGELVRAHMGAKVTGEKRTLVLASIAIERLTDGLMISALFVLFAIGVADQRLGTNLLYVADVFAIATLGVIAVLVFRNKIFSLLESLQKRFNHKTSDYTLDRFQVFINGLLPLCSKDKLPIITLWTVIVWLVELAVFMAIVKAYGASLDLSHAVLFMVAVNFSSLVPAAPGGFGVIEAIASAVLVSIGVEKEHALSMVISQHMIQYIVVGIPGLIVMLSWKSTLKEIQADEDPATA